MLKVFFLNFPANTEYLEARYGGGIPWRRAAVSAYSTTPLLTKSVDTSSSASRTVHLYIYTLAILAVFDLVQVDTSGSACGYF